LAETFSEGLAAVNTGTLLEGNWGFIDRKGDLVIKAAYTRAVTLDPLQFRSGLAQVRFPDKTWGYINKTGKVVWQKK
jgi:hypothetical protein